MIEMHYFVLLQHFLNNPAKSQFKAKISGAYRYDGITWWLQGFQYMIRTYGTPTAIREALENLFSICQRAEEDK